MSGYIHSDIWFQQDGATAHTSSKARAWLKSRFGNKVISHLTDFPWPARSPDLSPLDFFLWGYLKENVFRTKPNNIDTLKEAIREILSSIDQDTMAAVIANFEKRVNLCIQQQGGHFEHLRRLRFAHFKLGLKLKLMRFFSDANRTLCYQM